MWPKQWEKIIGGYVMGGKYASILKRTIIIFAIVALTFFNSGNSSKHGFALSFGQDRGGDLRYVFPAEFEKHEAVWLSAIDEKYFAGRSRLGPVTEIIKMLKPYVKLKVTVESKEKLNMFKELLRKKHIDDSHVKYYIFPYPLTDPWLRDQGPIFVRNPEGKLKIVDFGYSFYGESDIEPQPQFIEGVESIDREIAKKEQLPTIESKLTSEGGNRDFNGRGTMIAFEVTELDRNPGLTKEEIEKELMRILGQKKMIWLKRSIADEDKCSDGPIIDDIYSVTITGGHIDEVCRFVGPNTVLLAQVNEEERDSDPIMRISYERLEENYRILKEATDQDGKPFKIIRIPVADPILAKYTPKDKNDYALRYFKGAEIGKPVKYLLAASYLNFLVTNGVVLGAKYWKEGRPESIKKKDEEAKRILQAVFPDRDIIQIDAEAFNHGGGGIHCNTQQEPAR
jgi:agmatine deiminase